jgi:hypothetical protein
MSDELTRRTGASPSAVFVFLFLAGVAFAMAWAEYLYATDYEKAGGHPPVVHARAGVVDLRRTPIGRVAERFQPRVGVWGGVAVFAAPGLVFLGGATWQFRRRRA